MIKRIERPDWIEQLGPAVFQYQDKLDQWFTDNCEPINKALDSAVEVYGFDCNPVMNGEPMLRWDPDNRIGDITHKALLINIEPIKEETREEQLDSLVHQVLEDPTNAECELWVRDAKAALERES